MEDSTNRVIKIAEMLNANNSIKIVHFSRFRLSNGGDGGLRRTYQICSLLKKFDVDFFSSFDMRSDVFGQFPFSWKHRNLVRKLWASLFCRLFTNNHYFKWSENRRDELLFQRIAAKKWIEAINFKKYRLAVVDDPIYFLPLIKRLKQSKIPVVGLCHNIESLSKPQMLDQYQLEMLKDELQLLSTCDLVITISREESFLLTNLGIDTFFLPYKPSESVVKRMTSVRKSRETSTKADFVMFGTVGNPPTLQGMQRILASWTRRKRNNRLIVCGYGTEQLQGYTASASVEVKGSVSDEELDKLLISVRGAVIYQQEGSGALTKISELLLADVPIFANTLAVRTYYNLPGIFEFNSIDRLLDAADENFEKNSFVKDSEEVFHDELTALLTRLMSNITEESVSL